MQFDGGATVMGENTGPTGTVGSMRLCWVFCNINQVRSSAHRPEATIQDSCTSTKPAGPDSKKKARAPASSSAAAAALDLKLFF